jgi:nickel-dependent lactate racemase
MKLTLPYGKTGLEVELPDGADVYLPTPMPALQEPMEAVCRSLSQPIGSPPLRDLLRADRTVAIVVSDITRPVPNRVILPPVLQTIAEAGVPNRNVAVIVGTGMHRPMARGELVAMLGEEVVESYRIVNHDARDRSTLDRFVTDNGVEVWMNRDYLQAGFKLLTGFIEPHIFAGYSGGGKAVLPGLCGAETILANHGYDMLADHHATWCETERNPVFQDIRNTVLQTHPDFIVNVTLNEKQEITGVFSGETCAAHDAGIAQAAVQAVTPIPHLYDVAVSTNMGWPADLNIYQSMKGCWAAALQ